MSIYSIQPLVLGAVRTYPLVSRKDRKSTRLNSSHGYISYAVFCLKKKKKYVKTIMHTHHLSFHTLIAAVNSSHLYTLPAPLYNLTVLSNLVNTAVRTPTVSALSSH